MNGVEAYFSMINAEGGVAGRKLKLADQEDDQGSPTVDLSVAQTLVTQDHVFAVVGVGNRFSVARAISPSRGRPPSAMSCRRIGPTSPRCSARTGRFLDFATGTPGGCLPARQLGATSIAVVAYGVPQSAAACQAAVTGITPSGSTSRSAT